MIDIRSLETFYWIAALGSFSAASQKLFTTQPAVSQRISLLEDSLKVQLFERRSKGISLTDKGTELLRYAERILELRREMIQAAGAPDAMSGSFKLGAVETIVHTWLPQFMQALAQRYPELRLQVEVQTSLQLQQKLQDRHLDLAFLMEPWQVSLLNTLDLCRYPLAWVCSPKLGLTGQQTCTMAELMCHPLITHPLGSVPHLALERILGPTGLQDTVVHSCASVAMMVKLASAGLGICLISPACVKKELAQGQLHLLHIVDEVLPSLSFTAAWMHHPQGVRAERLAKFAKEIATQDECSQAKV